MHLSIMKGIQASWNVSKLHGVLVSAMMWTICDSKYELSLKDWRSGVHICDNVDDVCLRFDLTPAFWDSNLQHPRILTFWEAEGAMALTKSEGSRQTTLGDGRRRSAMLGMVVNGEGRREWQTAAEAFDLLLSDLISDLRFLNGV